jgi:hypothetical protein
MPLAFVLLNLPNLYFSNRLSLLFLFRRINLEVHHLM